MNSAPSMRRMRQTSTADSGSVLATMPDDPSITTAAMKHRRYFIDAIFVRMAGLSFSVQDARPADSARRLLPFDAAALKQRVEMLLLEGAQEDNAYLPVIKDGRITEIPVDQIECVEIYDQVVIVRLQYQELRTRMTAGHIKKCLGDRFLNVGDGLLINKKLIQNVSEGILYMKSGREHVLPLYERKKLTEQVKKMLLIERAGEA